MEVQELRHRLCVSFCDKNVEHRLRQFPDMTFGEARLDLMLPTLEEMREIFSLPIRWLATCHRCQLTDNQRFNLLRQAIVFGADVVDISLDENDSAIHELSDFARKNGCRTLISHHDYEQTLSEEIIGRIIERASAFRPDYLKIAYPIHSEEDFEPIERFCKNNNSLIIIGMSEKFPESRLKILEWGAPFTFVAPHRNCVTAKGQFGWEEVWERLKLE